MTTTHRTLRESLLDDDAKLDDRIRRLTNGRLCVESYKPIRLAFRAICIGAIIAPYYIPTVNPLPQTALLVLGALALGPDVVEAYLLSRS